MLEGELGRLRWRCRRGMKELDQLLVRYIDRCYAGAPADERLAFERLLDCEDELLAVAGALQGEHRHDGAHRSRRARVGRGRVTPQLDVGAQLAPDELVIVHKLRKVLHSLDSQAALDLLLDRLKQSRTNIEFLMQIAKSTPGE